MEKIVLVDGNSIFYRAFFALPLLKSEKGYSNAVYGFANILYKVIADLSPTHMAVAFDVSKHTFRNEIYADYKATRKPMPEELRSQIPVLKDMLARMNICVLEKEGLEGDDILGTIAHRFNLPVVIVTGDRDCFQLVDDTTTICRTIKGVTEVRMMDAAAIEAEFGLQPMQIVDLKALAGDQSDNIPGVSGIGDKTATTLLQTYGSVENLYDNLSQISGKLHEKLENGRENAFISKKLATIKCDVDIDCTLSDMELKFPFGESLREFFTEYQMRSFLKRDDIWSKEDIKVASAKTEIKTTKLDGILSLKEFAKNLHGNVLGLHLDEAGALHLSDGTEETVFEWLPLDEGQNINAVFGAISQILSDKKVQKVCFDAKQMIHEAEANGANFENYFDVSIARHLLDGSAIKSLEAVVEEENLPKECPAFSLVRLKSLLSQKMENMGVSKLYQEIELPLISVLADIEMSGFAVDREVLLSLKTKYQTEAKEIKEAVKELVGDFNINSPKQVGEVLFDKLGLPHNKKKSTGVEELEYIRDMHPVVPLILRNRKVNKFLSTYIEGIEKHIDKNNLIHTCFKQTLTGTGRLSSTEPNLQNIPIRGEESREIRSMFVARSKDNVLVDADYSQIELRLLAHFSDEESLKQAFSTGLDIHTQTACKIFNVPQILVTPEMRRVAKVVNFGVIYGISDFGLASDLGISTKAAKKFIDDFYAQNPKVEKYMKQVVEDARQTGFVRTIAGRVRKMVDISASNFMVRSRAERAAQNAPLQGSGADIIKLAMVKVAKRLKTENLQAKLIMQVHDELVVDSPKAEVEQVKKILKEEMENAFKLSVPLAVDVDCGYRWSEAH